jgi:hypothetical protein
MKRFLAVSIFLLLFIPYALSAEFWASKKSNKYHYPDCRWAQKINPENLIKFTSPEEAQKAGYMPCKVCKPPVSSKTESDTKESLNVAQVREHDVEQRQGCCSWHGGVCGCDYSTGRAICCDGTLSPSCSCQ